MFDSKLFFKPHLDLWLDVPESVCSSHVAIFMDTNYIQFYLHIQFHFGVCAHHLLDLLGGNHYHLCRQGKEHKLLRCCDILEEQKIPLTDTGRFLWVITRILES